MCIRVVWPCLADAVKRAGLRAGVATGIEARPGSMQHNGEPFYQNDCATIYRGNRSRWLLPLAFLLTAKA